MAWSNSKIFRQYIADMIGNVAALDYDSDTIKFPLYNNSITPDNDVTAANSAYNVGQWASANEVTSGAYASGGQTLASKTVSVASADTVIVDAADLTGTSITISAYGGLAYDDTLTTPVADQGMSYHYFGGLASVTAGTFNVVFNTNGLHTYTL